VYTFIAKCQQFATSCLCSRFVLYIDLAGYDSEDKGSAVFLEQLNRFLDLFDQSIDFLLSRDRERRR